MSRAPSPRAVAGNVPGDGRLCAWCEEPLPWTVGPRARTCSRRCRQAAFRFRRRRATEPAVPKGQVLEGPLAFAYADPPYPGLARRYYGREKTFAGEVDHRRLVRDLERGGYAGWALSTSSKALREVLPLCPPGARVCAWLKPIGVPAATAGLHSTWEPLIVVGGRQVRPGVCDWLRAMPARGWGSLQGRKPVAFCAWLFDCLGMQPGDVLEDLFPGTGMVGRAWREASRGAAAATDGRAVRWQTR